MAEKLVDMLVPPWQFWLFLICECIGIFLMHKGRVEMNRGAFANGKDWQLGGLFLILLGLLGAIFGRVIIWRFFGSH